MPRVLTRICWHASAQSPRKANESGKPANIVEKMVDGTMAKFERKCFAKPVVRHRRQNTVADVVAAAGKDAGRRSAQGVRTLSARRSIEKATSDFAAEVAAASGVPQPVA